MPGVSLSAIVSTCICVDLHLGRLARTVHELLPGLVHGHDISREGHSPSLSQIVLALELLN
jgi:hypothetical protein